MSKPSSPAVPKLMDDCFSWEVGSTLRLGGTVFRIVERDEKNGSVVLRKFDTQEERVATVAQLLPLLRSGELALINVDSTETLLEALVRNDQERKYLQSLPLSTRSAAEATTTAMRVRWVTALKEHGFELARPCDIRDLEIEFIATERGLPVFTARTLSKWLKSCAEGSLIPAYRDRGGAGNIRTDVATHQLFHQVLSAARSDPHRSLPLTATAIHGAVDSLVMKENEARARGIQMFSISTTRRLLNSELSALERYEARHGAVSAKRYADATGARSRTGVPGAIYEYDDMDSKVFCISSNGLGWGRPQITSAVDQASAYPTGRAFGKQPRSATSAIECIVHSIAPKDSIPNPSGTPILIHAYGIPTQAIFDNALYNDPRIVSLGEDIHDPTWARPFRPRDKREIEFLNHETTAWLRTEPGFKGVKGDTDALKEGLATAVWTFEQLCERHAIWLWGVYSNRPMRDGQTRAHKYLGDGQLCFRSPLPPDMRRLNLLRMVPISEPLSWRSNGIRYAGLTYHDQEMFRAWISRRGGSMSVDVRIDPHRLEVLYVQVPGTAQVLELFCHELDYAQGMTHYQHKQVLKICSQMKRRNPSLRQMYEAQELLRTYTAQWRSSPRVRERARAERTGNLPKKKEVIAVSDVELGYEDIASVSMCEDDEGFLIPEEA